MDRKTAPGLISTGITSFGWSALAISPPMGRRLHISPRSHGGDLMAALYRKSEKGVGEMLCMPGLVSDMAGRANRVAARARATAPVGPTGEYGDSFVVTSGIRPASPGR